MFSSLMPDLIGIGAGPAEAVRIASRAGFAGLDIRLNRFADEVERINEDALRDAMDAAGLRAGYCSLTPQKIGVSQDQWDTEMKDLRRRCELARALGYTRATSVVLPFHTELPFDANMAVHRDRVREAADVMADYRISFGLEYVSPETRRRGQPHEFVYNMQGMLALLDAVGRDNVGMMLDMFHWHCAGETPEQIAALPPSRIVAVHVCDLYPNRPVSEQTVMERGLPGEFGIVDNAAFLGALAKAGYDGPVTAEPTNPRWKDEVPETAARLTAESIDACFDQAGITRTTKAR